MRTSAPATQMGRSRRKSTRARVSEDSVPARRMCRLVLFIEFREHTSTENWFLRTRSKCCSLPGPFFRCSRVASVRNASLSSGASTRRRSTAVWSATATLAGRCPAPSLSATATPASVSVAAKPTSAAATSANPEPTIWTRTMKKVAQVKKLT